MVKKWFLKYYPFIAVAIAPFILFFEPIVTGKAIFWGTPILQFIPWQVTAFEQLKHGIFPLWNPLNGMGAPLLANYQLALFYPPNWIMFLFYLIGGAAGLAWGQTISIAFHLAWAGCGMVILTRRLGLGKPGQTISGLSFALCGFLVARGSFFPIIWAVSWMPWIIYAATFIVNPKNSLKPIDLKNNFNKLALLVFFITMQLLSGHAQMTWYTLMFAAVWVFCDGVDKHNFKSGLLALGTLIGCVIFAALISSIQLLPTFEYLQQSQRASAVNFDNAMTYSFWPWRFLTLLSPTMFGSPAQGNYWGYGNYWEDAIYIGVLPFFIALSTLGLVFKKKVAENINPHRPLIFLCWITIFVSILLALGKNFILFPFLFKYVPTFSMFQSPTRFMVLAEFCLCLLAGIGLDRLKPLQGKRMYWARLGTMGAFAVAVGAFLALVFVPSIKSTLIRGFAIFGFFALGTGLIILFQPKPNKKPGLWSSLLIGFVMLDLLIANWNINPTVQASFFKSPNNSETSQISRSRLFITNMDEYAVKFKWFYRFDSFLPAVDWQSIYTINLPNANLLTSIPMVNNFDPIVPARYAILIDHVSTLEKSHITPWLQIMNVGTFESIDNEQSQNINLNLIVNAARFRWFTCVQNAGTESEAWTFTQKLLNNGKDFNKTLIIEKPNGGTSLDCAVQSDSSFTLLNDKPQNIELQMDVDQNGYLFVADTWYPGWKAWVDGKEVEIIRADFNFRAIPISKGTHIVKIKYVPDSFKIGSAVTLISLSGMLVYGIMWHKKKKTVKKN
jgi:hypothetical protein